MRLIYCPHLLGNTRRHLLIAEGVQYWTNVAYHVPCFAAAALQPSPGRFSVFCSSAAAETTDARADMRRKLGPRIGRQYTEACIAVQLC